MDRNYIDTHLAVDRYVMGTLSEEEAAEFEERLVWDQSLMDEVDLAEKLRDGLRRMRDTEVPISGTRASLSGRLAHMLQVPVYAAAASFLLAVGITSVFFASIVPDNGPPDWGEGLQTEIVPLFATRGTEPVTLVLSEDAWAVLLVDTPAGYERFRAAVRPRGADANTVWSRGDLMPTYPSSLAVGMPASILAEQEYVLALEGIAEGADAYERIQEIPFVVSRKQ